MNKHMKNRTKIQTHAKHLTASHLGILTGDDIKALLKDTKSWLFKLYADCLLEAAITKAQFKHFVEASMLELKQAREELDAYEKKTAAEREAYQEQLLQQKQTLRTEVLALREPVVESLSVMQVLKTELQILLSLSQQTMTPAQLNVYNQQLTTNFNNQIAATFIANNNGSQTFATTLLQNGIAQSIPMTIPQFAAVPSATPQQVLQANPGLASFIANSSVEVKKGFAADLTNRQTGVNASIFSFRNWLDANNEQFKNRGQDVDQITLPMMQEFLKKIDAATQQCRDSNKPLRVALAENNMRLTNEQLVKMISDKLKNGNVAVLFSQGLPTVSQPPAFFSPYTIRVSKVPSLTPGPIRKKEEEEQARPGYGAANRKKTGK